MAFKTGSDPRAPAALESVMLFGAANIPGDVEFFFQHRFFLVIPKKVFGNYLIYNVIER